MAPNIILIVCDTLRKDILELYGGEAKTPNLKKFIKDSMVYDNAIAPSPWTFPSHVSLFTGLYASQHGVHETEKRKIPELMPMNMKLEGEQLADYLSGMGYNTIGMSNNIMVSRFTGFGRGFAHFFNIENDPWLQSKKVREAMEEGAGPWEIAIGLLKQGRFDKMAEYAREFARVRNLARAINFPIDKGAELTNRILFDTDLNTQFFLFLNYFEVHDPYKGENRKEKWAHFADVKLMSLEKIGYLKNQYIVEMEYLDEKLGELMEMLKLRGLYDDSLIIITSDHGQAFNEHGYMYHEVYLYDEIIRIPLIIKYPHNKKFKKRSGYQSFARLYALIRDTVEGRDDRRLTERYAIAEAYGIPRLSVIPKLYRQREGAHLKAKYERVRKAIYKDGFKLTVDGSEGVIEEFMKNDLPANPEKNKAKVRELIHDLEKFVGEDSFLFPEI